MLINLRNGLMSGRAKETFQYFGLYIVSNVGGTNGGFAELGRCYLGDIDLSSSEFIGYGGYPSPEYDRDRIGRWIFGDARQKPQELVSGDGRPYGFGVQNRNTSSNNFGGPYLCPFKAATPIPLGITYIQQGGRWGDSATTSRRVTNMSLLLSHDAVTWFSAYHYQGTPASVNFGTFIETELNELVAFEPSVSRFIKTL